MLKSIATSHAPAAIGPYSQAVIFGNLLFTSGQIPLQPNGELLIGDIKEQAVQVFANLEAVLREAGTDFNHVVKATVFLKDMNQFAALNEVYATYFTAHKPARSTVEVARLPRDVLVEIELIAAINVEKV